MIVLSDEQIMLRDMAKSWVADRAPVSALRTVRTTYADHGSDPALYAEMAEMGWTGILIPEAHGGVDMGLVSLGLIAEELGRNLTASPLLSTSVAAVSAILRGDNEAKKAELLPAIATGSLTAALAIDEGAHHRPDNIAATARVDNDGWVLNGAKRGVAEALSADLLIVAAKTDDGIALFACPADKEGVEKTRLARIDSRGAADLRFTNVRLDKDALLGSGQPYVDHVLDALRAAQAAEMLGGAVQAFETTLDYLRTRVQFDHPIGSFQALQHRAADMMGEIELTRSAVYAALTALDTDDRDAPMLTSLAKAMAGQTFRAMAKEMIQMHGGIGMTDEHDAGLYLKRAHTADVELGNAAFHRERYAQFLNI